MRTELRDEDGDQPCRSAAGEDDLSLNARASARENSDIFFKILFLSRSAFSETLLSHTLLQGRRAGRNITNGRHR